jgi:serine/threonine-protein kinase
MAGPYPTARTEARTPQRAGVALASGADVPVAPGADQLDSGQFAAALDEPRSTRPDRDASRIKRSSFGLARMSTAGVLLLLVLGGTAFYLLRARFRAPLITPDDPIVLTEIENRTGDRTLDGAVAEALQIDLAQSPYLQLRSLDAYRVARRMVAPDSTDDPGQAGAQSTAKRLGAKAYLFGAVTGTGPPYLIHVDLLDTASNDIVTSAEEHIPSLQQIPIAVDHLAGALRSNMGESGDSISRSSNTLQREATTNLEAMHVFSEGAAAAAAGKTLDALRFYQAAASLEPRFVQAQIQLAVMYRRERAELAAADAAKLALAAADDASERTRTIAQYEYEMNVSGDFPRAANIIRQLVNANPHDADSLVRLARALRLEGRFGEAQQAAQQALGENSFSLDAYTESESALIGLDKYEAASLLDAQAQRTGVGHLAGTLTSAYLGDRQQDLAAAVDAIAGKKVGFRPDWNYGIYLDNTGQLHAGAAMWRDRAEGALEVRGLESTAGLLLAQGAVDRALIGDCAGALAMARESDDQDQGITAVFSVGMANALCGNTPRALEAADQLQQTWPQSFAVKGFYLADIRAAIALHDQDPTTAVDLLKPARQYDLISLTPVLRGRAHVALRQVQISIVDFQTVLAHRGVPFVVGSVSYPVAQIGVARAFGDAGDQNNSAEAYRRFLDLWKNADANQPLLAEARSHSR